MQLIKNISCLYTGQPNSSEVKRIEKAAIIWDKGTIVWVGSESQLPGGMPIHRTWDAGNKMVVPALIDCHTHLAFGGNRWTETTEKIQGVSYLDIAARGGGIQSTVSATRATLKEDLLEKAQQFVDEYKQQGVSTIECKSGYGLNLNDELKLLEVYEALAKNNDDIRIVPTLLAAHTFPREFKENRQGYIDLIKNEIIPKVAEKKLAVFFDIFVEKGSFTFDEAIDLCTVAKQFGMKIKLHVDQLSNQRGGELSEQLGAISADHLECITDDGIEAIKRAKTIAVSLPIASAYLNQPVLPARKLLNASVPVAVATDFNPGSAPVPDLLYAMNLAVTLQRMTADEVLLGATKHAAIACDRLDIGMITSGYKADFLVLNTPTLEEWIYGFRHRNAIHFRFFEGACTD